MFVPNAIDRAVATEELKIPVVRSNPLSTSAPLVNVVVPVAINANASPNVVVPDVLLIVNNPNVVLVLLVIVPVPSIVAVNPLNVPPLDNVKLPTKFSAAVPGLNVVVPKSRLLNQLPVAKEATLAPVVNVNLGAVVAEPPDVFATENVLVLLILATVNPPVPVYENPPMMLMFNTTVAAVV